MSRLPTRWPVRCSVILLAFLLHISETGAEIISETEWKVARGETLYAIARAIYPGNALEQARFRRDIVRLNPAAFAAGASNLSVGTVLKLPDYIAGTTAAAQPKSTTGNNAPSTAEAGSSNPTRSKWRIRRGDTLYAIARFFFPGDTRKQAQLRRDIIVLNPGTFAGGSNNMAVGTFLTLPAYAKRQKTHSAGLEPEPDTLMQSQQPSATTRTTKQSASTSVPTTQKAPKPSATTTTETQQTSRQSASSSTPVIEQTAKSKRQTRPTPPGATQNQGIFSLGFSLGGDEVIDTDGWADITAGSGGQLRVGYERLPAVGSGYRVALGLQYNPVEDGMFRDTYLQLAYQFRNGPLVYGIGISSYAGATAEEFDETTDYDSATGALVYVENIGPGKWSGIGLSFTQLDIEEKDTGESVDASRAELYYSWRF